MMKINYKKDNKKFITVAIIVGTASVMVSGMGGYGKIAVSAAGTRGSDPGGIIGKELGEKFKRDFTEEIKKNLVNRNKKQPDRFDRLIRLADEMNERLKKIDRLRDKMNEANRRFRDPIRRK